ncbi:hypothetical protein [Rhizobium sp. PL01]|uniref:hypothetical protein n=1 Tax=Rhizobium sp. PL01 TaxID=3085631 RepID=UPI002981BDBC|nr:hypothetical protein [Rhizobium sp. PL01]MDW5314985.1 hypothetical protein [Rhizobium sp. PL01]
MNLSQLLATYGDDKVVFQALDTCMETMNMTKGHTKITFGTEQPINLDGTVKMGLVVWLDRGRVAEIVAVTTKGEKS